MNNNDARVQQFKADVADMRLRDPATGLDRLLLRVGLVGMIAGPVLALVGYFLSHSATGDAAPLQQRDAVVQSLLGVTITIVGAALYLKAALAGFLRFWMARLVFEQQRQQEASQPEGNRAVPVPPAQPPASVEDVPIA
jgi:hypothetical protein